MYMSHLLCLYTCVNRSILVIVFSPLFFPELVLAIKSLFSIRYFAVDTCTPKCTYFLFSYVAWNIHEPSPGLYNFHGDADLLSFIQLVNETGLLLILRPG